MNHYFIPYDKAVSESTVTQNLRGVQFSFVVSTGLFSLSRVDRGSITLIEYCDVKPSDVVLDLGCGYGPVGVSLAKTIGCKVSFSDVNSQAVLYAQKNAKSYGVAGDFFVSDGFSTIPQKFTVVLLNPPQSAGKKVCEQLIQEAKEHLLPGGSLQIVARKNKGGESLSQFMQEIYGNVTVLTKKGGFWVYKSSMTIL